MTSPRQHSIEVFQALARSRMRKGDIKGAMQAQRAAQVLLSSENLHESKPSHSRSVY